MSNEWLEEDDMAKQNEVKGKEVKQVIVDEVKPTTPDAAVPAPSNFCTHDRPADTCETCAKKCARVNCGHPLGEHATKAPHVCLADDCACLSFDSGEVIVDE